MPLTKLTYEQKKIAVDIIRKMVGGKGKTRPIRHLRNFILLNYHVEYTLQHCNKIWNEIVLGKLEKPRKGIKREELIPGKKYGLLEAIREVEPRRGTHKGGIRKGVHFSVRRGEFKCSCGKIGVLELPRIFSGVRTSCGHEKGLTLFCQLRQDLAMPTKPVIKCWFLSISQRKYTFQFGRFVGTKADIKSVADTFVPFLKEGVTIKAIEWEKKEAEEWFKVSMEDLGFLEQK